MTNENEIHLEEMIEKPFVLQTDQETIVGEVGYPQRSIAFIDDTNSYDSHSSTTRDIMYIA